MIMKVINLITTFFLIKLVKAKLDNYQVIGTPSSNTEELYISKIITKNNANKAIKKPIIGVVPQPGATLPYSELSGFRKTPIPVIFD
jgi:hypothetical protein